MNAFQESQQLQKRGRLMVRLCLIVSTGAFVIGLVNHLQMMNGLAAIRTAVETPQGCVRAFTEVAPGVLTERVLCPLKGKQVGTTRAISV